ncbi:MAG: hypothetical protein HYU03_03630 [Thaumarchaeota archaeon]|nr:hypothetical protein [Nitrososphaerota archaeon]
MPGFLIEADRNSPHGTKGVRISSAPKTERNRMNPRLLGGFGAAAGGVAGRGPAGGATGRGGGAGAPGGRGGSGAA